MRRPQQGEGRSNFAFSPSVLPSRPLRERDPETPRSAAGQLPVSLEIAPQRFDSEGKMGES